MEEFKLIVAGSRGFTDYDLLTRVLFAMADVELANKRLGIVSGMARGADQLGVRFAGEHGLALYKYPANPSGLGKRSQYIRNTQMGMFADALLVFTDGSKSTNHIIDYMHQLKKPVHLIKYNH